MLSLKHLKLSLSIGLPIALLIAAASDQHRTSLLLRGDFPAFYAAGTIVLGNTPGALYSSELQASVQTSAWPSLGENFYYFAYPPWVALALAPLALFDPIFAKLLWTAFQLLALWLACGLLANSADPERASGLGLSNSDWFFLALAAAPIFFGVISGQNVALSLLCYSLICAEGRTRFSATATADRPSPMIVGPLLAGIGLGIWMFKPHFAAVAFFYLALAGRKRVLLWSYLPIALYLLGTQLRFGSTLFDVGWLKSWVAGLAEFADRDYAANAHQMISFLGAANSLKAAFGIAQFSLMQGLAWLLALGVFGCTGWHFLKVRRSSNPKLAYQHALALLGPTIVLITPHALFYDAGLCLVSLALLPVDSKPPHPASPRDSVAAGAIAWAVLVLLGVMRGLHESLPLDPLGPAIFGLYIWLLRTGRFKHETFFDPSVHETEEGVVPNRS